MENWLERLPNGARVMAIRLRSLGDCVLSTPALHLIKTYRPDLRLGVVVEDAFAPVFTGNADVSDILPPSLTAVAGYRPGLCLNLHGGTRSLQLLAASRARWRAGFAHFRLKSAYNIRIPAAQEVFGEIRVVHTAEHIASAMFYLGVPRTEIPGARLFARGNSGAPVRAYAVIHPKASQPDKTWPAEKFHALAAHLERNLGLRAIFIAGPHDHLSEFTGYECRLGAPLEDIKTLISSASLFVGNDSGPAHMAAAFGVSAVVFFGSSDARIWGPWKTRSVVLQDPAGIGAIGLDAAVDAAGKLLPVTA